MIVTLSSFSVYQNVNPAPFPPVKKLFFSFCTCTDCPFIAAACAAVGIYPGGGGGTVIDPLLKRAPESKTAVTGATGAPP